VLPEAEFIVTWRVTRGRKVISRHAAFTSGGWAPGHLHFRGWAGCDALIHEQVQAWTGGSIPPAGSPLAARIGPQMPGAAAVTLDVVAVTSL
jgi:hypothetical protein